MLGMFPAAAPEDVVEASESGLGGRTEAADAGLVLDAGAGGGAGGAGRGCSSMEDSSEGSWRLLMRVRCISRVCPE